MINTIIRSVDGSKVEFEVDGVKKLIDLNYYFSGGVVLFEQSIIVVFHERSNKESDAVGKVFDLNGKFLSDILFPKDSPHGDYLAFSYYWCQPTDKGVYVVFSVVGVNASYRDFGCILDLGSLIFGSPCPA